MADGEVQGSGLRRKHAAGAGSSTESGAEGLAEYADFLPWDSLRLAHLEEGEAASAREFLLKIGSPRYDMKVHVPKVVHFGVACDVLFVAPDDLVQHTAGVLEDRGEFGELLRMELVKRLHVPAQHDDQPAGEPGRVRMLDQPELADVDRRAG